MRHNSVTKCYILCRKGTNLDFTRVITETKLKVKKKTEDIQKSFVTFFTIMKFLPLSEQIKNAKIRAYLSFPLKADKLSPQ